MLLAVCFFVVLIICSVVLFFTHPKDIEEVRREIASNMAGDKDAPVQVDNRNRVNIAGINHRKNISQYCGQLDCALLPEPSNEFDPNAIKVIAEDGHHLGYVPSDQTDYVRSLTDNKFPFRCECVIKLCEDLDDGHRFFVGTVFFPNNKKEGD